MHKLVCDLGPLDASTKCQLALANATSGSVAACPMKMMCLQSCLAGHVGVTRCHLEGDMREEEGQ